MLAKKTVFIFYILFLFYIFFQVKRKSPLTGGYAQDTIAKTRLVAPKSKFALTNKFPLLLLSACLLACLLYVLFYFFIFFLLCIFFCSRPAHIHTHTQACMYTKVERKSCDAEKKWLRLV
jgi:hypothetical protein